MLRRLTTFILNIIHYIKPVRVTPVIIHTHTPQEISGCYSEREYMIYVRNRIKEGSCLLDNINKHMHMHNLYTDRTYHGSYLKFLKFRELYSNDTNDSNNLRKIHMDLFFLAYYKNRIEE